MIILFFVNQDANISNLSKKDGIIYLGDPMLDVALKLLQKIEDNGYVAYIVGGFVRDYILKMPSSDIDICTNATPSEIRFLFSHSCLPNETYGSITVVFKNIRFEITTFRRELSYLNNRKPVKFEYIDNLLEDLKRRDFTINAICMDKEGNIIDLLNGKEDLKRREICTIGDSYHKFTEDSLRILRAVRFATILNFRLSDDIKQSIRNTKYLVRNLSYYRKKEELNKIFASVNVRYGIKLLLELELDQELELPNLKKIKNFDDLIGIWSQLEVDSLYPFMKNEKEIMGQIRKVLKLDNLDCNVLYHYGLYVNSIAASMKNIDKKIVTQKYNALPIKSRNEIVMNGEDISKLLNKKPGLFLKEILTDIENQIVVGSLKNDKDSLTEYILQHYR